MEGTDSFKKLNGMFAFSILDWLKNKIIISRDYFGEKIIWASEMKSIVSNFPELKKISDTALNMFLSLTYIPAPQTIYDQIYKLEPGHFLEIDLHNFSIKKNKFWEIDLDTPVNLTNYDKAKQELKKTLYNSVEKRMISDVPLGVFLSGGVDSTIVAAIMSDISPIPIKTFSVGYSNPRYDESQRARLVANHIKSDHHEYTLDYDEILHELDKIILNYDEPFADSSSLLTYFISKKTVNQVKVALTGDGGDEIFGGYNKYLIHSYGKLYHRMVPNGLNKMILKTFANSRLGNRDTKSPLTKIRKMLKSVGDITEINHLNILSLGFSNIERSRLLNPSFFQDIFPKLLNGPFRSKAKTNKSNLKIARFLDMHISLEGDMLVKVDRASMLNSLECRAPFLDHNLAELSYRMLDKFLIKGMNKKRILKDTFEDMLPKDFFRSPKFGFEVPVSDWLRKELKEEIYDVLSKENLNKHNFFRYDYVEKLLEQHINQNHDQSVKLWTLFCFQKWYNYNFAV